MADSPEMQKAQKRYQDALAKYDTVHRQTNDPAQHKAAEDEVHNALSDFAALRSKSATAASPATGAPKSAWDMLTGR